MPVIKASPEARAKRKRRIAARALAREMTRGPAVAPRAKDDGPNPFALK